MKKNKLRRTKSLSALMALIMTLGSVSSALAAPTVLGTLDTAVDYNSPAYTLAIVTGPDPADRTPLTSGDTVSLGDTLAIKFLFDITEASFTDLKPLVKNGDAIYEIALPPGLEPDSNTVSPNIQLLTDPIEGVKYQYGTLFSNEGKAYLRFEGDLWNQSKYGGIEKAWAEILCKLDEDMFIGGMGKIEGINGGADFSFKLPDTNAVVKKTALGFDNGLYKWKVELTTPSSLEYPLTFTDILSGAHSFETSSLNLTLNDVPVTAGFSVSTAAKANDTLTFNIYTPGTAASGQSGLDQGVVDNAGANISLTYFTRLDETEYANNGAGDSSIGNTAKIEDRNIKVVGNDTVVTVVSSRSKETINKDKAYGYNSSDPEFDGKRTLSWKVFIKTNDRDFYDLVLHDTLPANLLILKNSFVLTADGATDPAYATSYDAQPAPVSNQQTFQYTIPLKLPDNTDYAKEYVLTYKTEVTDEFLKDQLGGSQVADALNDAWLTWNRYSGKGTSAKAPLDPSVEFITKFIKKSAGQNALDLNDHTITWTVTVNPNKLNVTDVATITDILTGKGLVYMPGSLAQSAPAGWDAGTADGDKLKVTAAPEGDNKTVLFTIPELGRNTATFTFKTAVDETETIGQASLKDFWNKTSSTGGVEFINETDVSSTVDGNRPVFDDASGSMTINSEVLDKTSTGYDYATGILSWQIVVNKNKVLMTNVEVTDDLAGYLTYLPETLSITGSDSGDFTSPGDFVRRRGQELIFDFKGFNNGAFSEQLTIKFGAKLNVDDPALEFDKTGAVRNLGINTATMIRDGFTESDFASAPTVSNPLLGKSGKFVDGTDEAVIHYTVTVNPNKLDFRNVVLTDAMSPNLELDFSSVRLYYAKFSGTGFSYLNGTQENSEANLGQNAVTQTPEEKENHVFNVKLPDGKFCYILEYDCYVVGNNLAAGAVLANKIKFEGGSYVEGEQTDNKTLTIENGGGGGKVIAGKARLLVTKKAQTGEQSPLEGAVYTLQMESQGEWIDVISKVTSNEKGEMLFSPLTVGRKYRLVEVTAPKGYYLSAAPVDVPELYTDTQLPFLTPGAVSVLDVFDSPYGSSVPSNPNTDTKRPPEETTAPPNTAPPETSPPVAPQEAQTANTPPAPPATGNNVWLQDDGSYVEYDEDGVPLGVWTWNPDEERWEFEEFPPPLTDFPATGDRVAGVFAAVALVAAAVLAYLIGRRKKEIQEDDSRE